MVQILDRWQVWDPGKGCFFVGLTRKGGRYAGWPVYTDANGKQIAIRGAS